MNQPKNIGNWIHNNTKLLENAGIGTTRLDCLVLLEDATNKDRSWLLAHPEANLENLLARGQTSSTELEGWIGRRAGHEPLAYIRGETEFYGRVFKVDNRVLEPRPESETMIYMLKALLLPTNPHIADVGTGSGALGITAALEIAGSTAELIDIDPGCLAVARENLKLHKVTAELSRSDLLEKSNQPVDVVLANLPYVPDSQTINQAAMQEPEIAIFGGHDGLEVYRKLFGQLASMGKKPTWVLAESLPPQHRELENIAKKAGFKLKKTDDFILEFLLG